MAEPVPSKRPRARDSSLATVTSSTAVNNLVEFQIPVGPFWDYFHKFDSVDHNRNWSCTCKLCNKTFGKLNITLAKHHLLKSDIVDTYILQNETESDCDDGDGVPQVVPGVSDTESNDESL